MGFRFQRRISLKNGFGLNVSGSGVGSNLRTRRGSIGTSGFSLRTGIPGLSYRQRWGKRSDPAAAVGMVVGLLIAGTAVLAVHVALLVAAGLWQGIQWGVLTSRDYIEYKRMKRGKHGDA